MADSPLGNGATGGEQNSSGSGGNDFTASPTSSGSDKTGPGFLNVYRTQETSETEANVNSIPAGGRIPAPVSVSTEKTGPQGTNRAPYRLS